MPIIPPFKQSQRLQIGSPSGLPSGGARLMEGAVKSFAGGIADLGRVLDAEDKRTKAAKDRITSSNMSNDVKTSFIKAVVDIKDNGSDGDKDVEILEEHQKTIMTGLKKSYGAEHHAELDALGKKFLANSMNSVAMGAIDKRKVATQKGVDRLNSSLSAAVYEDPDSIMEALVESRESVGKMLRFDHGMDEERVNEEMTKADKRLIMSRIQSLMKNERYDNAVEDINTSFAKYFTSEERTKAIDMIRAKEYQTAQRGYALENIAEKKVAKEFEASQNKNFLSILSMANESFGDPKKMKVVEDMMDSYKENNLLTIRDAGRIEAVVDGKIEDRSRQTRFDIVSDIAEDVLTADQAVNKINREVIKGNLGYKDAEYLTLYAHRANKTRATGNSVKRKSSRDWLKAHLVTGELEFSGMPKDPTQRQVLADANIFMDKLVESQGLDWYEAAQVVAKKYGTAPYNMPYVPGVPAESQKDSISLRKAGGSITVQFQSGAIDKVEYVDRMKKVDQKLKALELQERVTNFGLDKLTSLKPDETVNIPFRPKE